mmetsp:Transcript_14973/g.37355  ORF Transcript_14973/g.37355 Transcript_14973/m.37355 type:complete len:268 (-) Transcript_14973:2605-3408(-)
MSAGGYSYATLLSAPHAESPARAVAPFPKQLSNCLVYGPAGSGLSSLAAMFALNMVASPSSAADQPGAAGVAPAAGSPRDVVVLTMRTHMEARPPALAPGMDHTHPWFKSIKIRYLASYVELKQYAGCMHLLPAAPAAVVVDGLLSFFRPDMDKKSKERELAKTLAMLADGVGSARVASGCACPLLVTDEAPAAEAEPTSKHFMYVLQRWLPLVLEVKGSAKTGLTLSASPTCPAFASMQPQLQMAQVHFSMLASLAVTGVEYASNT